MGNADLRRLAAVRDVTFEEIAGSVVAVDAHNWLYRYLTTTVRFTSSGAYTTADGEEVANLVGAVQGLPKFFEHGLTPVFVFDGGVTDLKSEEIAARREARERAEERLADARERGDALEVAALDSRTQRLTAVVHETTRGLFDRLDVPYVEAPAEGEAQCAHMAATGAADYAGSEDYDALLFGSPCTLRELTSSGDPELMDLDATLAEHGITREQLVDVAVLVGTDFNEGVHGYGPKTALAAVKEHGDLASVVAAENLDVPDAETVRALFLDPDVCDVTVNTDLDPDVAAARTYVVEEWGVAEAEVATAFERIEDAVAQTGLDRWQ